MFLLRSLQCYLSIVLIFTVQNFAFNHHANSFDLLGDVLDLVGGCNPFSSKGDSPPEEDKICSAHTSGIAVSCATAAAAAAIIGGIGAKPACIGAAVIYVTGLLIAAETIGQGSRLCQGEGKSEPLSYTDSEIKRILQSQGVRPTIDNIVSKYDKMCVEYGGSKRWLGDKECTTFEGATFCSFNPNWIEDMMCVRVSGSCPCLINVNHGHLKDPDYEEDGSGSIKLDGSGNPVLKDEKSYTDKLAVHCRMKRILESQEPFPEEYGGLISEICNSWRGASKNDIVFTAGVVQCFVETMRNIFEKHLQRGSANTAGFFLSDGQLIIYNQYQADYQLTLDASNLLDGIITASKGIPLSHPKLNDAIAIVAKISNRTAYPNTIIAADYTTPISLIAFSPGISTNGDMLIELQKVSGQLKLLAKRISQKRDDYRNSVQQDNSDRDRLTMFESFQGAVKILSVMAIMGYVTVIGLKIIMGDFSITLSAMLPIIMQLAIVYYFALGDAWREYLFNTMMNFSTGLSEMVFEAAENNSDDRRCRFNLPYIPTAQGAACHYPNPSSDATNKYISYVVGIDRGGYEIYGCRKGPFITRPEYEMPYKPVIYKKISGDLEVEEVMKVYCTSIDDPTQAVLASVIHDQVTGRPILMRCPDGTIMEKGYRISELTNLGIINSLNDVAETLVDDPLNGVVETAFKITDSEDRASEVNDVAESPDELNIIRKGKYSKIVYLENEREKQNRVERHYPIIQPTWSTQNTVERDMSYVSLFDTLDCKAASYFQYHKYMHFDLWAKNLGILFFSGPIGLIVFIIIVFMGILMAGIIGNIAQAYIVNTMTIVVLAYLSPVIVPMMLFDNLKGTYNQWKGKLIACLSSTPVLFLSAAVAMKIIDYAIFGPSSLYASKNLFLPGGEFIDGVKCWADDIKNAPFACLLSKISAKSDKTRILGNSFLSVRDVDLMVALLLASLKTFLILYFTTTFIKVIDSKLKKIFGDPAASLGTIFDKSDGLFNKAKGAASSLKKSATDVAKKSVGEVSRAGGPTGGGGPEGG